MFEEQTPSDGSRFKNRIRSLRSKHFNLFISIFFNARISFSRRKVSIRMSKPSPNTENEVQSLIHTARPLQSVYWQLNYLDSQVYARR